MLSSAEAADVTTTDAPEDILSYRALSRGALLAILFSIIGLLGWLTPVFIIAALLAVGFGWTARRAIRKYPDELSGKGLAIVALLLSVPTLLGAPVYHVMNPTFQVPEGYQEVPFESLQPNPASKAAGLPFPPEIAKLDGKQVFITGYVHPGVQALEDIKTFVLIPDMKTCCFGGQPKMTDMVEVTIVNDSKIGYSYRRRGVGGVFHVRPNPRAGPGGIKVGYYALEADHIQ